MSLSSVFDLVFERIIVHKRLINELLKWFLDLGPLFHLWWWLIYCWVRFHMRLQYRVLARLRVWLQNRAFVLIVKIIILLPSVFICFAQKPELWLADEVCKVWVALTTLLLDILAWFLFNFDVDLVQAMRALKKRMFALSCRLWLWLLNCILDLILLWASNNVALIAVEVIILVNFCPWVVNVLYLFPLVIHAAWSHVVEAWQRNVFFVKKMPEARSFFLMHTPGTNRTLYFLIFLCDAAEWVIFDWVSDLGHGIQSQPSFHPLDIARSGWSKDLSAKIDRFGMFLEESYYAHWHLSHHFYVSLLDSVSAAIYLLLALDIQIVRIGWIEIAFADLVFKDGGSVLLQMWALTDQLIYSCFQRTVRTNSGNNDLVHYGFIPLDIVVIRGLLAVAPRKRWRVNEIAERIVVLNRCM